MRLLDSNIFIYTTKAQFQHLLLPLMSDSESLKFISNENE